MSPPPPYPTRNIPRPHNSNQQPTAPHQRRNRRPRLNLRPQPPLPRRNEKIANRPKVKAELDKVRQRPLLNDLAEVHLPLPPSPLFRLLAVPNPLDKVPDLPPVHRGPLPPRLLLQVLVLAPPPPLRGEQVPVLLVLLDELLHERNGAAEQVRLPLPKLQQLVPPRLLEGVHVPVARPGPRRLEADLHLPPCCSEDVFIFTCTCTCTTFTCSGALATTQHVLQPQQIPVPRIVRIDRAQLGQQPQEVPLPRELRRLARVVRVGEDPGGRNLRGLEALEAAGVGR